jgi:hypothetical protein
MLIHADTFAQTAKKLACYGNSNSSSTEQFKVLAIFNARAVEGI